MKLLRFLPLLGLIAAGLGLGGCGGQDTPAVDETAIFGDGSLDGSRVIADVEGFAITEHMLDLRFAELPRRDQNRFQGEEGRRIFVRQMIDEVLRVRAAEQRLLQRDPTVARVLISQRRSTLDQAFRNDLVKDREPEIEQVRAYFEQHRDDYMRLGSMHASHIECATQAEAAEAYRQINEDNRPFAYVVADFTKNDETLVNKGDMGWFNKGGFIAGIDNPREFTEAIWDLEVGLNPPLEFEGKWHVVKIHERKYGRRQTLEEAYDRVVTDMMPEFQAEILEDWLRDQRQRGDITFFGEFRPGHGKSAKELFERAFYAKDEEQKLDLLGLLVDDYPESEYADDALFMAGNVALDTWGDLPRSSFFFRELLERYPESDYAADAEYILANMNKPDFVHPRSIEDLQQNK